MGVEDDQTDPAICVCDGCLKAAQEAARVADLWQRERITQTMTVVDLHGVVVVYVVRDTGRVDCPSETIEGRGRSQLEAMEKALRERRGAVCA